MTDTLMAIANGQNRCDTITKEHWNYLVKTLPIRVGRDKSIKGDDDGIISSYLSRKWQGGYTDYKDHRKDGVKALRDLARENLANRPMSPQYITFFRNGYPIAFRVTGYMGGISISTDLP